MPSFSPFPPPTPASRFLLPRYLAIQSIPVSASPYKDAQLILPKLELPAHPTSASSHASALEQRLVDPPLCSLPFPSKHFTPSYTCWSSERWKVSLGEGRARNERDGEGEFGKWQGREWKQRRGTVS